MPVARLSVVLVTLVISLAAVGNAGAQVIYQPVRYQYGQQQPYYYAGSDPRVFAFAESPVAGGGGWGRVNGYDFVANRIGIVREVAVDDLRTFTDALPGYNAAFFGYTVSDVRNEAYARVPQYFRKRDLLAAAVQVEPGTFVVPATAPGPVPTQATPASIIIRPSTPRPAVQEVPRVLPRPSMIIPKSLLEDPKEMMVMAVRAQPFGV